MDYIMGVIMILIGMFTPTATVAPEPTPTPTPSVTITCDTDDWYMIPECMELYNG